MSENSLTQYNGVTINFIDDMVNLTNMWKAADGKASQAPAQWMRHDDVMQFIKTLTKKLNVFQEHIWKSTRGGRTPGTYAHWQIALVYAAYLSPEFHMWANQVVRDRIEEMANPDLALTRGYERHVKGWRAKGKSDEWIKERIRSIITRKLHTDCLETHGCDGRDIARATNATYRGIFGRPASQLRPIYGRNPRDGMSDFDLSIVVASEAGASEIIENEVEEDPEACIEVCKAVGEVMGDARKKIERMKCLRPNKGKAA